MFGKILHVQVVRLVTKPDQLFALCCAAIHQSLEALERRMVVRLHETELGLLRSVIREYWTREEFQETLGPLFGLRGEKALTTPARVVFT